MCLSLLCLCSLTWVAPAIQIGNHPAVYDGHGILLPWTPWRDAIQREVNWYLKCPVENGYPRFVYMTFMDGNYEPLKKNATLIPATQDGTGIISYLKYHAWQGKKDPRVLQMARYMGDYLVKEANTPDEGKYPHFTRSTGWRDKFPQPPDCGSQDDKPYEIQPDKGGIAGYALLLLYEETKDDRYMQQALQNARVLATNMVAGTATNSPWPFRADYRTGVGRGEASGNMSFNLRLFDKLIEHGHQEFQAPRDRLWAWITDFQLPSVGPFAGMAQAAQNVDEGQFTRLESIINSMTKKERLNADIINGSRRKRIALGAGVEVQDVNQLLRQYSQMSKMFKQFGKGGMAKNMMRGGMGAMGLGGKQKFGR